jgi:hypothetical protein
MSHSLHSIPFPSTRAPISLALSESSFKHLRGTYIPSHELPSLDNRHKVVWKMFSSMRYENDLVEKVVPKFQSLIRMRIAQRRWRKMFGAWKLGLTQGGENGESQLVNLSTKSQSAKPSTPKSSTPSSKSSKNKSEKEPSPKKPSQSPKNSTQRASGKNSSKSSKFRS